MSKKWLTFLVVAVIVLMVVTFAIFFYWNIDDNNKWSTFFSFMSTFGIVATITVYSLQKKHVENSEKKRQKEISISYLNIFTAYAEELKTIVIQLVKLRNLLDKNNNSFVEYIGGYDIHAFILKDEDGKELGNARMFKFDSSSLSSIHSNSASVNINISENYLFLYKHSIQINTYIENLILKIHYDNSKENILDYFSDISLDKSIHTIDLCVKDFKDYCKSL